MHELLCHCDEIFSEFSNKLSLHILDIPGESLSWILTDAVGTLTHNRLEDKASPWQQRI